jgi:hypothetical protein
MSRWTNFNNLVEKHERGALAFIAILLFLLAVTLLLTSCGTPRGPLPPGSVESAEPAGLASQLATIGDWFIYIGLLVAGVALVARIAGSWCVPFLAPFVSVLGDVAELAIIAALVGGIFVWLSAHFWILVLASILTALAWAWLRRAAIRRWLDRIKAQAVKP